MTTTRARQGGKPIHFPPPGFLKDSVSFHDAPSPTELRAFAESIAPKVLPLFAAGLLKAARRRRYQPRWSALNRARLELARLCVERMLAEGLDIAGRPVDDAVQADDDANRDLVAEAFHTFGEDAARELADELSVAFDDCAEAIKRLRHRPH